MNKNPKQCPECGGPTLFHNTVKSAGPYGPALLPGLGGFLNFAKVKIVVCSNCGLTRFYAEPGALAKLPKTRAWRRV